MAGVGVAGLRLLGLNASPFAFRARVALNIKGVSYEYIEQDLFNKGELLVTSNQVHKKVPVLIHNGKPICESLVIVQYVDEVWGGAGTPILPADPYKRAISRFWAVYIDNMLYPACVAISKAPTEQVRAEKLKMTHAVIQHLEEAFSECSNGKAFFGGDSVGYVDLALGCFLPSFGVLRKLFGVEIIDATKSPHLTAWAERFKEAEVVKEVLPDPDKALELYYKKLQVKWATAPKWRSCM